MTVTRRRTHRADPKVDFVTECPSLRDKWDSDESCVVVLSSISCERDERLSAYGKGCPQHRARSQVVRIGAFRLSGS